MAKKRNTTRYDGHAIDLDNAEYDVTSPESIENYGRKLIGKTFDEVCESSIADGYDADFYEKMSEEGNHGKGNLGELVEYYHFHYHPNSISEPDFQDAGVELKVTPYRISQDGKYHAKERLVVSMIDFFGVVGETFPKSAFWHKGRLMLLVYYRYMDEVARLSLKVDFVRLFTPPESDIPTIQRDWEIIQDKILQGLAHELHCGDTSYIEACPKGGKKTKLKPQPYSTQKAFPRAWAFKSSYMTYVLNRNIIPDVQTYVKVVPEGVKKPFEEYIAEKIQACVGMTFEDICNRYEFHNDDMKDKYAQTVFRILGIRNNQAEEFVKAGIAVKSIRLEVDGLPKEPMKIRKCHYCTIAEEEWEDAEIADIFRETRFLFVVYKMGHDGKYHLAGCKFWAMPYADLEIEYRKIWERMQEVVRSGVVEYTDEKGNRHTFFPKSTESQVGHVRPDAWKTSITQPLPNGGCYTEHAWWLNRRYVAKQLGRAITSLVF